MKIFVIFIASLVIGLSNSAKRKAQGKLTYTMNWVNGVTPCEDFDNKILDANKLVIEKDTPMSTMLTGEFEFKQEIIDETAILLLINKETPQGKVLAYTLEIPNLCDHIKEEGMPWSIFIDAMNLDPKSCPLPAKVYPVSQIKLDMNFTKDIMTHDTVGEYIARLEIRHKGTGLDVVEHDIACYDLGFTVDEVREKSEEK